MNHKGEVLTVVTIVVGVTVLVAVGAVGIAWNGLCQLAGS